jgi:hypothetical protein
VGNAPATFFDIAPGGHMVMFQKEGFETVTKTLTITAGKTTAATVFLEYTTTATPKNASLLPGFEGVLAGISLAGYYICRRYRHR